MNTGGEMEENKKHGPEEKNAAQGSENFIRSSAADTEEILDYMHEEIRKRPLNRRRILRRARETALIAVLFGVVACVVFALLLPVINNILYRGDEKSVRQVTLPEESRSEEISPQEIVEKEKKREATEERELIREEIRAMLDENVAGVEQHKRISLALQELAASRSPMLVTVTGLRSDTDWFNEEYVNKNTTSGLVTKKTDSEAFVLVQSRRIATAQQIRVTFNTGAEAEAEVRGSDAATGLSILTVPLSSLAMSERAGIEEMQPGSSAGPIITGAPVIAIGSPTGQPGSVVYGNVTGADQRMEVPDNDLCRLTTDIYGAADATGFLINLDGAVVGMIDMRWRDANVPNMLCAVGISELRPIIRRLESGGQKAWLGVCGVDVSEAISDENGIPVGVWVTRVEEDSPAMDAGIQKGDVITGLDKKDILHMAGLIVQLESKEPGQIVGVHIRRQRGGSFEEITLPVTLQ